MGSWSENCGLSGMEIGCGEEAYVGLLGAPKYSGHGAAGLYVPRSTFIRGTYDDYGYLLLDDDPAVLAVFNDQTGLKLENGEQFSLDHLDGIEASRLWLHGKTMDFLSTIEPEFPYVGGIGPDGKYESIKVASIGESAAHHLANIRVALAELEEQRKRFTEIELPTELAFAFRVSRLYDLFNSEVGGRIGYRTAFAEAITAGKSVDGLIEAYRRGFVVEYGFGELRRQMVPSESVGPQHGGHVASLQFAKFLIDAQATRSERWSDEDEGDDE